MDRFATPRPPSTEVETTVTLVLRGEPTDLTALLDALDMVVMASRAQKVDLEATGFALAFGAGNELGWEKRP